MVAGRQRSQPPVAVAVTAPGRHPAVRAEPRGIGSAGARDPLAREVRLLGALLGQVIVEQAGGELFELVERLRRSAIQGRRGSAADREALRSEVARIDPAQAEAVVRAFTTYFLLVNLAEERHRVRVLARRERRSAGRPTAESLAAHVRRLRSDPSRAARLAEVVGRLRISPVLTAHPTEARRRTLLVALRRLARLVERLDDPRLTPSEDREIRHRLREEIGLLWRTAALRTVAPTPLDEVRTTLVYFDETIYSLLPRLYRSLDVALGGSPLERPIVPAFVRLGTWVGGDRDGNPGVTASTTERALRIQADHVMHGHEAVASRLMQTISVSLPADAIDAQLRRRLARDADELPDTARTLERRFPDEPYRQRFGFIAERLRRTRNGLTQSRGPVGGQYGEPAQLVAELDEIQSALVADGLPRSAWGDVQDFRWQVESFGFHLAEMEVRQHAAIHRAALAAIEAGGDPRTAEAAPGVGVGEVLESFRVIERLRSAFGAGGAGRVIVSFTASADDAMDVLRLAQAASQGSEADASDAIDVVPLFESADALTNAGAILDELLSDPAYRTHLDVRGRYQEVMLGYSDSNKESGFVAANWQLHRAQADLVAAARRHEVELTVFHGRGGAIGRGGGWPERAILGQPAGSVDGRLKLTEQGEVIAARYADPTIARQHLEILTGATLRASVEEPDPELEREARPVIEELAEASRDAYRALVFDDPGFGAFFAALTPIDELSELRLGSRPAARPGVGALRAIPWVFAWSQARVELPGWFGLGTALERYERRHPLRGLDRVAVLYRRWPFLASVLDHAELALARSDLEVARRFASLATAPGDAERWATIEAEHARTRELLPRVLGREGSLEAAPEIARSLRLRSPYLEALGELEVAGLAELRAARAQGDSGPRTAELQHLVRLAVSGVAAGLQSTG